MAQEVKIIHEIKLPDGMAPQGPGGPVPANPAAQAAAAAVDTAAAAVGGARGKAARSASSLQLANRFFATGRANKPKSASQKASEAFFAAQDEMMGANPAKRAVERMKFASRQADARLKVVDRDVSAFAKQQKAEQRLASKDSKAAQSAFDSKVRDAQRRVQERIRNERKVIAAQDKDRNLDSQNVIRLREDERNEELRRQQAEAKESRRMAKLGMTRRERAQKRLANRMKPVVNEARGLSIPLFSGMGHALGGQFGGMLGMGFGFQGGAEMLARMPMSPKMMMGAAAGAAGLFAGGKAAHSLMNSDTRSRLAEVSGTLAASQARSELKTIERDMRSASRVGGLMDHQSQVEDQMADAMAELKDAVVGTIGPTIIVVSTAIKKVIEFLAFIAKKFSWVDLDKTEDRVWDQHLKMMMGAFEADGNPTFREAALAIERAPKAREPQNLEEAIRVLKRFGE